MKCWTFLALLFAVFVVFLGVGYAEETTALDDFEKQPNSDTQDDGKLEEDSFIDPENDDDDSSENALENVNENPSNVEDEPKMFKRTPGRRRRRRRRRRRGLRIRLGRIKDRLKKACEFVKDVRSETVKKVCRFIKIFKDEEFPKKTNDEWFVPAEQGNELEDESWLKKERNDNQ